MSKAATCEGVCSTLLSWPCKRAEAPVLNKQKPDPLSCPQRPPPVAPKQAWFIAHAGRCK
eukprot:8264861-Pyramimonas_sp.AAC.1